MSKREDDKRVLICAPIGRDGPMSADVLSRAGVTSKICADLAAVTTEVEKGAASVLLTEECLFGKDLTALKGWARSQPAWSDIPFLVLTSRQERPTIANWRQQLVADFGNVAFLERPVQTITLTSAAKSAIRARSRQYEVRDLLEAKLAAWDHLESEVAARTAELARANAELHGQILERARVEDALRQSQKMEAIGQLTGGVAHDFNNLLMVISGGLEMMDRQTDPARRKRLIDGMRQAADRGAGLTRQLLAFSRRQELKPEPIDLQSHLGGMKELLDRSLRGDVSVEMAFDPDLWPIEVDPGELELVILNLAVNARDAMPHGGSIKIRCHNRVQGSEDFVVISVSDPGVGMPPEVKSHVFEPFYTTKEIGRGSGLGLAQVYGFVKQSGGSVSIESNPGLGTEVTLTLPRSVKMPRVPISDGNLQRVSGTVQPEGSVLLVEDDDEVARLVQEMLSQLGYHVTRTASAAAALGALSNGRHIDLIFSDVMMPGGMNGIELAREVRARRGNFPVLLTTAHAEAVAASAASLGLEILRKPYRLEELATALKRTKDGSEPLANILLSPNGSQRTS